MGLKVWGLGVKVQGLAIQGLGFGALRPRFRVQASGCRLADYVQFGERAFYKVSYSLTRAA